MREADEFWEELLAQIEAGQVIPVVGPELLTVVTDGSEVPLYQALAERLLAKYGLAARIVPPEGELPGGDDKQVGLRKGYELNDAVSALARRGRRVQDLYRPIHDLLKALLDASGPDTLQTLRELASVRGFRIFVTTTPDDLLARAIDAERHDGMAKTDHVVFAPKLASGTLGDLPEVRSSGYAAVCYLFGKVSTSPFVYAIHDEDTLEFIHSLQIDGAEGMKRLFSDLRTQNLLLIGCNFPDWLSRFFIRLANTQRLADNRSKREFLIEQPASGSGSLTMFLERFSPDTWVFPGNSRGFAGELAKRWQARHPESFSEPDTDGGPAAAQPRTSETCFISYSRNDIAAARLLFDALQKIGVDVAWFDKSDLKPGDDFERKIRSAIAGCFLFLPLVSANTEARDEGFFREEWSLARERARRIQGRKFIVPVVIDRDYDGNAVRYKLVPDGFLPMHFGHAPDGRPSDELDGELRRLIRERRSQRPA